MPRLKNGRGESEVAEGDQNCRLVKRSEHEILPCIGRVVSDETYQVYERDVAMSKEIVEAEDEIMKVAKKILTIS